MRSLSSGGQSGVKAAVRKRQFFSGSLHDRCRATFALVNHGYRRFDRNHETICWFIGARAGTDIDDSVRVPKCSQNCSLQTGICLAKSVVALSDSVVDRGHGRQIVDLEFGAVLLELRIHSFY